MSRALFLLEQDSCISTPTGRFLQVVVEKKLKRERGLTRHDVGREAFVEEVILMLIMLYVLLQCDVALYCIYCMIVHHSHSTRVPACPASFLFLFKRRCMQESHYFRLHIFTFSMFSVPYTLPMLSP